MRKKLLWNLIMIIFIAGFIALSAGFYKSMQVANAKSQTKAADGSNWQEQSVAVPDAHKDFNTVKLLVLGDSIAHGTGDTTGKGFAGNVSDYLKKQTAKKVAAENNGIDGQKSAGMLNRLQSGSYDSSIASADFIIVSIGGNDLLELQALSETSKEESFKTVEDRYLKNLQGILKIIRKDNKNACVIDVGLYNPAAGSGSDENSNLINLWNSDTKKLVEGDAKSVYIPTYDIFKFNLNKYLSTDGLHPNSEGYRLISDRIEKAAEDLLHRN